jgi:phospholipid/cholesterol/gamma-HCH transport system substrate-binding protein
MNRSNVNLWVGCFVALGLGAILFLALRVGNLMTWGEPPGYHVSARFDNIGNLKPRAPVKSAGVVVGRVESIGLDGKTFEAIARIKIFPQFLFTKDTIAAVYTSGLLGEQFIGLDAGGDTVMLQEGDEIKKTQSAVQIEKLISQFMFNKASEGTPAPGAASPPAPAVAPSVPAPVQANGVKK